MNGEKIKMAPKNYDGVELIFSEQKTTETPSSGFVRNVFLDANLLIIRFCVSKVLFGSLDFEKMGAKFKMASETYIFCNFALKTLIFNLFQKPFCENPKWRIF
jgi:hypothetical protein